jgi:hypothetical protein
MSQGLCFAQAALYTRERAWPGGGGWGGGVRVRVGAEGGRAPGEGAPNGGGDEGRAMATWGRVKIFSFTRAILFLSTYGHTNAAPRGEESRGGLDVWAQWERRGRGGVQRDRGAFIGWGTYSSCFLDKAQMRAVPAPRMLPLAKHGTACALCRAALCCASRCHMEGSEPGCGAACCWPEGSPVHVPSRQDQHSTTRHEQSVWADSGRAAAGAGSGFWGGGVTRGGGLPPAGHTQRNQGNPTAGGLRQSLTSEIRLTTLSQEVPSARVVDCLGCCLSTQKVHPANPSIIQKL